MIKHLVIIWLTLFSLSGALGCAHHNEASARVRGALQELQGKAECCESKVAACGDDDCHCADDSCGSRSAQHSCICGCGHTLPDSSVPPATSVSRTDNGNVAWIELKPLYGSAWIDRNKMTQSSLFYVSSESAPLFILNRSIRL